MQGFGNDTAGQPKTGGKGQPTFTITPAGGFPGTALLTMEPYCRVSGVALDAGGLAIDVVDIAGTHAVIDSHSLLENGNNGVVCPGGGATQLDGLQIKDVEFENAQTSSILINAGCENDRLIGDLIENSGKIAANAPAVSFASNDITIANGIIEGSSGPDLFINNAGSVVVSGMAFAGGSNNIGSGSQAPTIELANSTDITLTGNRFQGGGTDGKTNSDVLFSGTLNNVALSNNIYSITSPGGDANAFPSYIYDVSNPAPTLTNSHLYETPQRPALSVFSGTIAQALLAPLQVPQFTNNQLSGLTLSNGSTSEQINVAPGSAADSTNSTLITLTSQCVVDLTSTVSNGPGGLDTGSVQPNTTYYIFVIAAVGAGSTSTVATPSCMASKSLTPAFTAGGLSNTGYQLVTKGGYPAGSTTLYNLRSLAGVAVGDIVSSTDDSSLSATSITALTANSTGSTNVTTWGNPLTVSSLVGINTGMAIVDPGANQCIPSGAYIQTINSGTDQITVSAYNTGCSETGATTPVNVYGALQLVVNTAPTMQEGAEHLAITTGYYRLVGALYTDSNSAHPNVVPFRQDGDTFYLKTPVVDINPAAPTPICNTSFGTTAFPCALSVPCGHAACAPSNAITVEAFGRIVGGNATQILLTSPDQTTPGVPTGFPGPPGYTTNTSTPSTSFPFRLYTNTSGQVNVTAAAALTTQVYEDTDGWVFHRAQ